jgi:salicylate hydroxylase
MSHWCRIVPPNPKSKIQTPKVFFRTRKESIIAIMTKIIQLILPSLALLVTSVPSSLSLSSSSSSPRRKPVERVAVVGAGIAGLSTLHALGPTPSCSANTLLPRVECFDARTGLDQGLGAGIQLNGGLAVLGKINPAVMHAVMAAGMPAKQVRSRAKSWSENATPFETLLELDLAKTVRAAGGAASDELILQDGQLLWYSIMRGALQETLYETLPEETRERVQFGKTLTDIVTDDDCSGLTLKFADGTSSGPFDLVIGCDGVKSAVKEYIEEGSISRDAARREGAAAALYSGVRIRYAVKDGDPSEPQAKSATLSQYFGNGAYALDGTYGAGPGKPNAKASFIVYLDDEYIGPFKKSKQAIQDKSGEPIVGENADWTQDVLMAADRTREKMLEQLRVSGIPDTDLVPTISNADRFFDFGVYFHNPFTFAGWSKEIANSNGSLAVLCGDAAHAFPPFLGQGSNQAIQDAYCLAKKVHQYNAQVQRGDEDVPDLKELFKEYEKTRWPATFGITWKAAFLGYLETGGQEGVYAKFRDVFFKTMGVVGVAQRVLISAATPKV